MTMFSKEKNAKAKSGRDFTQLKTPHTYAIIFFAVVACWLLTFLIPAGKFSTHTIEYVDSDGDISTRTVLMADTFRYSYNLNTDSVKEILTGMSQDEGLMEELGVDLQDGFTAGGVRRARVSRHACHCPVKSVGNAAFFFRLRRRRVKLYSVAYIHFTFLFADIDGIKCRALARLFIIRAADFRETRVKSVHAAMPVFFGGFAST